MKLSKGSSRYVLEVGPFAIKAPRTNPAGAAQLAIDTLKSHGIEGLRVQLSLSEDLEASLRGMLFAGLKANKREERLAKEHPEAVIATRSILGILNLQPRVDHPDVTTDELKAAFTETMGDNAGAIGHEIEDVDNFGVRDGEVVLLDGGSKRLEACLDAGKLAVVEALEKLSASKS